MPNILIVDNDHMHRFLIQEIFAPDGSFTFRAADDGRHALGCLQSESFDLVLVEIGENPTDALQLCHTLKNGPVFQRIKVVFVTTYYSARQAAQQAGADACLVKPYNPEELETVVHRLLDRGEGISRRPN